MANTDTATKLRHAVAEEVRVAMVRRRMTGAQLASAIGRSQAYVSRRLNAETAFDTDDLERIASTLGVNVLRLFPREGINDGLLRPTKRGMRSKLHARPRPGMTRISASGTGVPATIRRPVPVAYRSDEAVA